MNQSQVSTFALYCSVGVNAVLAILLWGTLRVAPSDVINRINAIYADLEDRNAIVLKQIDEIKTELDARAEWIAETDSELTRRTKDRIFRSEFVKWREDAARINPGLNLPPLNKSAEIETDQELK